MIKSMDLSSSSPMRPTTHGKSLKLNGSLTRQQEKNGPLLNNTMMIGNLPLNRPKHNTMLTTTMEIAMSITAQILTPGLFQIFAMVVSNQHKTLMITSG